MAEALLRSEIAAAAPDLAVESLSAGVFASDGMPASRCAVEALDELGVDLRYFHSQPVTSELVAKSDVIFVMTRQHRDTLVSWYPEVREKVFLLKEFGNPPSSGDVADPYSYSLAVYRQCRDEIRACIPGIIKFLKQ